MKITLRGGPMDGDQITIPANLREAVLLDGDGNRVLYLREALACLHNDGRAAQWFEWWSDDVPESPYSCPHTEWPARWKLIKAAARRRSRPMITINGGPVIIGGPPFGFGPGIGGGPPFAGPGFGGGPGFDESHTQQIAAAFKRRQRDEYRRRI